MDRHEWTDGLTGKRLAATADGVTGNELTIESRNRGSAREILRLAEELAAQKALLVHELTVGAEEIRKLSADAKERHRELIAQLGATLDLERAAMCPGGPRLASDGPDIPPFQTSLGAELLAAAWSLRADRDRLAEEVERLKAALSLATDEETRWRADNTIRSAGRSSERARIRQELLDEADRLEALGSDTPGKLQTSIRARHLRSLTAAICPE